MFINAEDLILKFVQKQYIFRQTYPTAMLRPCVFSLPVCMLKRKFNIL